MGAIEIQEFWGIDTSKDDVLTGWNNCADCANVETLGGALCVARGFSRYTQVPLTGKLKRLIRFRRSSGALELLAAADDKLYKYHKDEAGVFAWTAIHTFPGAPANVDYAEALLATKDVVIIVSGVEQPKKWDGTTISDLITDIEASKRPKPKYIAMYKERVFATGDVDNPYKLYYSKDYDLNRWGVAASGEAAGSAGGFIEIGLSQGDKNAGLKTYLESVIILKNSSVWRLSGETPKNFYNAPITGETSPIDNRAWCAHSSGAYIMVKEGLELYDGMFLQPTKDYKKISGLMAKADISGIVCATHKNCLYFAVKVDKGAAYNDTLIVYDTYTKTYTVRNGFEIADMITDDEALYVLDGRGYVVKFDDSDTYDGQKIEAFWQTPQLDGGEQKRDKVLRRFLAFAQGENGCILRITAQFDGKKTFKRWLLMDKPLLIRKVIRGRGKRISIRFENTEGKYFKLSAVEFETDL